MIEFTLNGQPQQLDVDPDTPLLSGSRDVVGLTGTKFGCGIAVNPDIVKALMAVAGQQFNRLPLKLSA